MAVFDHETGVPWGRVTLKGEKFEFTPLPEASLSEGLAVLKW